MVVDADTDCDIQLLRKMTSVPSHNGLTAMIVLERHENRASSGASSVEENWGGRVRQRDKHSPILLHSAVGLIGDATAMTEARLLFVQPYVPRYRVAFFERVFTTLKEDGIECRVAAGRPAKRNVLRGDAVSAPWLLETTRRQVKMAGKTVGTLGSGPARRTADAVIIGLQGSSLDTYGALIERWTRNTRVGLWGHVKSYVNAPHPIDVRLEAWQARHADHVFAYTPGGAAKAMDYGVSRDHITTVMNSVDVSPTVQMYQTVPEDEVRSFQRKYGIDPKNSAMFVGGLDRTKRIEFLQQALDQIWERDPEFKLVVGGQGSESYVLQRSVQRGQVVLLGVVGPYEKALMARSSRVMAMPGRIGLVAVESLALNLPIVTTVWPHHAPEAEYLVESESRFSSKDDPSAYADLLLEIVARPDGESCRSAPYPDIDSMVANFRLGVLSMIS